MTELVTLEEAVQVEKDRLLAKLDHEKQIIAEAIKKLTDAMLSVFENIDQESWHQIDPAPLSSWGSSIEKLAEQSRGINEAKYVLRNG